jgi:hypothetical protein
MLTNQWQTSSRTLAQGNCVEVRLIGSVIEVRDSKDVGGPTLRFSNPDWVTFIRNLPQCGRR